jgi:8-oxo-dGTP pyrophosphatase MutT (NUDIX family)
MPPKGELGGANNAANTAKGRLARLGVTEVVRAAGGVVRDQRDGSVLLVHRRRYDDWSFPKGKALEGESDEECALREVEEETGVSCELEFELPTSEYRHRSGRPKRVRYWAMRPLGGEAQPLNEIDDIAWFSLGEAQMKLSYDRDRVVLRALAARAL